MAFGLEATRTRARSPSCTPLGKPATRSSQQQPRLPGIGIRMRLEAPAKRSQSALSARALSARASALPSACAEKRIEFNSIFAQRADWTSDRPRAVHSPRFPVAPRIRKTSSNSNSIFRKANRARSLQIECALREAAPCPLRIRKTSSNSNAVHLRNSSEFLDHFDRLRRRDVRAGIALQYARKPNPEGSRVIQRSTQPRFSAAPFRRPCTLLLAGAKKRGFELDLHFLCTEGFRAGSTAIGSGESGPLQ